MKATAAVFLISMTGCGLVPAYEQQPVNYPIKTTTVGFGSDLDKAAEACYAGYLTSYKETNTGSRLEVICK
jgi:hypothetical protein